MMKPLRIFLVNVGLRSFNNYWVVPPMGLLALAAYLREKMDAQLLLTNQRLDNRTPREIGARAGAFEADVVGLSSLTAHAYLLNPIIRSVRAARPRALVVVGGAHASALGPRILDSVDADAAVIGEGEIPFEQLVRASFDGGDLGQIAGLVWRSSDGYVNTNPGVSDAIEDLDSLPLPAYDLLDLPRYWCHQTMAPVFRRRYASLETSRGCPYRCIFCHNIFGKQVRMQSADRVVDEIAWLHRKYQIKDFEIIDDMFNFDAERVIKICEHLGSLDPGFNLTIPNGIRGDLLDREQADALADAGLYQCMIALESGSPRIQKLSGKNLDIARFLESVDMMARRRVFVHTCCMMGFPTETETELKQTIDVACQARTHTTSFFTVTPFPGTQLFEMVRELRPEKLEALCFDRTTFVNVNVNLTDLPDDLLFAYIRKAFRQYYFDPGRLNRLIKDHPQPWSLPLFAPLLTYRLLRGVFG